MAEKGMSLRKQADAPCRGEREKERGGGKEWGERERHQGKIVWLEGRKRRRECGGGGKREGGSVGEEVRGKEGVWGRR